MSAVGIEGSLRAAGRKLLAPYLTGGICPRWTDYLRAYQDAGADLIELGLPFSDPLIDGPTIQQASDAALSRGASVESILAELAAVRLDIPLFAMTYYNLAQRGGFCARLREAGIAGLIVPDAPLEEADALAAAGEGLDLVLLTAPSTPGPRRREIAERSRGFVYAASLMGTTGVRDELAASAGELATDLKRYTDRPVLLGLGISSAEHAVEACRTADGVVLGSILMRKLLAGESPAEVGAWLATIRGALDREYGHAIGTAGGSRGGSSAQVRGDRC